MVKKIIEINDLSKEYKLKEKNKTIKALDNVNLSIQEGEIFGLLGPNGAGKTTLLHILTTLKQPTSGEAFVDNYSILKNPKKVRRKIALMLESGMIYYRITAYDNLKFFCKIYEVPNYEEKIYEMAEEFGLKEWLDQYVEYFSSGMKMKLALCRTFLLNRKILFLDEPTLGLDVQTVSFIVNKIKKVPKTIFLTTHDMNVVEKLCDRIGFINQGKILKIGEKEDLKKILQREITIKLEIKEGLKDLKAELKNQTYVNEIENVKNGLNVKIMDRSYYRQLLRILSNFEILKVKEKELSLEDLFLMINQ